MHIDEKRSFCSSFFFFIFVFNDSNVWVCGLKDAVCFENVITLDSELDVCNRFLWFTFLTKKPMQVGDHFILLVLVFFLRKNFTDVNDMADIFRLYVTQLFTHTIPCVDRCSVW